MNLYVSTYLFAAALLALGIAFAFFTGTFKKPAFDFLRSMKAAAITFGGGGLWFLYMLSQLGEADFGEIKLALIAVFGAAGILAFFYFTDFLSVRGLSVLALIFSSEFIKSAFLQEPESRLVLVTLTYAMIIAALYFGALPYRLRDFFNYLYEKPVRAKAFGGLLCACAASLVIASIFY